MSERIQLEGKKFGKWTVIKRSDRPGRPYYLCRCDCGTEKEVCGENLRNGKSTNCGCVAREMLIKRHADNDEDLTGKRFGELTVESFAYKDHNRRYWDCLCSCGKHTFVSTLSLTSGRTVSCGHVRDSKVKSIASCGTNPASIASGKLSKRNSSGIKGVYFDKNRNKWCAEIMFMGTKYRLGRFEKIEDAAAARKKAEDALFGDFLKWYKETYPDKNKEQG